MFDFIKKQPPVRIIAFGFLITILIGSILLYLPFSHKVDISFIDALYTSTSAVCVTGLATVDIGTTFTTIGQVILAFLIQIGGLGVTTIGAGIIILTGKKMDLKSVSIIKESSNLSSGKGVSKFVGTIFRTTLIIELVGMLLSFIVFIQDMDFLTALWVSIFHSVASFNNSGFDILGGITRLDGSTFNQFGSLIFYKDNVLLNLTTSGLVILGGIGFLVIREVMKNKFKWKKYSMHTKVVITLSTVLIVVGTIFIKFTEDVSWLGALFFSVSARTAGFATYDLAGFTRAGILVITILMYIGASPGSTGGGIKTTTFFAILQGIKSSATNKSEKAFKYSMPKEAFKKAAVIATIAMFVILCGTYLMCIFEPQLAFMDVLFEMVSAFATVGLSTGITSSLTVGSKIVSIVIMYIGRLGPLTIASLWYFSRGERFSYPEGNISIG